LLGGEKFGKNGGEKRKEAEEGSVPKSESRSHQKLDQEGVGWNSKLSGGGNKKKEGGVLKRKVARGKTTC